MLKKIDEHSCEHCDNERWLLKLDAPKLVRVVDEENDKPDYKLADYAIIDMIRVTFPNGTVYRESTAWAADEDGNAYPACIYMTTEPRDLQEVTWILGTVVKTPAEDNQTNDTDPQED